MVRPAVGDWLARRELLSEGGDERVAPADQCDPVAMVKDVLSQPVFLALVKGRVEFELEMATQRRDREPHPPGLARLGLSLAGGQQPRWCRDPMAAGLGGIEQVGQLAGALPAPGEQPQPVTA